jgi:aminopeptidase N
MAPKAINFMEFFTNVDFMLEKLDQIAIPDFASGAMENWGLVTYR